MKQLIDPLYPTPDPSRKRMGTECACCKGNARATKQFRILFITSTRIGDAVLSTGLLANLVEKHPDARFTIACGPAAADLFRAAPRLDKLVILSKKKFNGHWFDLWRDCIGTKWDLVVDLRNSIVSRLLFKRKATLRPAINSGRHKVIDNAAALGLDPPPAPHIWLSATAENTAKNIIPDDAYVIALGPSANWPAKQWPIEKFKMLAQKLTASNSPFTNARILIVAAPHEREQVVSLINALPPSIVIEAIGHDLLTVAACLKRCRLFVGNDSGLMHIAAAVGIPTLGLFGPGFEKIYGPWGDHCTTVRTPESAEELLSRITKSNVPCLMDSLNVDTVYENAVNIASEISVRR